VSDYEDGSDSQVLDNQVASSDSDSGSNDLVLSPVLRRHTVKQVKQVYNDFDEQGVVKLRDIFCTDRFDTILRTTAEINGLEHLGEPRVEGTLSYGSLGLRRDTTDTRPTVEMATCVRDAGSAKKIAVLLKEMQNTLSVGRVNSNMSTSI
jgi:hypothetical protein